MQTAWGEIEVIDSHVHFFSHNFFRSLATQRGESEKVEGLFDVLQWEPPPVDNRQLADRWKLELDRHGVAKAALIASIPEDEASVAEAIQAHPDRFYGYFMLNPLAPDATRRVRRAFDELGLRGVCLFPAMHRFSVQYDILKPIFEMAAQRPNVVVFVHMGMLTVGVRKKLGLPSRFDMSMSNPLDLHRVALEFPNVQFIIPHFGAGFLREALMLGELAPNVYLDTSSSNSWTKFLLPEVRLKDIFRKALEIYGHQRLLFGSDSSFLPRGWNQTVFDVQVQILQELGVTEEAARAIFGGNLKRLLS